ncbi:MAG TPA: universal stress protein [Tardiphaga sp.]
MSYATLMAYVNVDRVSIPLVHVAAGLADKFAARLVGLSAIAVIPPFVAEGVVISDNATEFDIAQMRAKLADAEHKFRAAAGAGHLVDWRSAVDFPTDTLISEARCADLIVIGQNRPSGDLYRVIDNGAAILGMGRPTLMVPEALNSLPASFILVGWKNTREARRAIQDALPFLRQAERVMIVEICEDDRKSAARDQLDDVMRYLSRHRIASEVRVEAKLLGSGADRLIQLAQEEGADLLVTGAYGHSRLNEWIFGGITRDLLMTSPICCLMSH